VSGALLMAHLLEKVTDATFPQVDHDRMIARNVPKRMGIIGAEGPQLAHLRRKSLGSNPQETRRFEVSGNLST
jgi:hypothetical protein